MARTIEFFYGIGSRYSYLASTQMEQLARDTGATVRWRPLYSRVLMEWRGMDPFKGAPASGQYETAYRTRDVMRWAKYYGIPFHDPDWDALDWQRFALAAVAADRLGGVASFTKNLFDAVFGSGTAPENDAKLARIADSSGLEGREFLRTIDDAKTHERHDENIADASPPASSACPASSSMVSCSGAMTGWSCCATISPHEPEAPRYVRSCDSRWAM
jgi:2-hydroxychromene-2-carboxylate isomerase